jgi:hypothetical protein
MADSHFQYCALCRADVLLNQTQRRCAGEHGCEDLSKCVLRRFFTGTEPREAYVAKKLSIKGRKTPE